MEIVGNKDANYFHLTGELIEIGASTHALIKRWQRSFWTEISRA